MRHLPVTAVNLAYFTSHSKCATSDAMNKTVLISMRVGPDLKAKLMRLAKRENRSLTNYIETMLRDLVERNHGAEKRQ